MAAEKPLVYIVRTDYDCSLDMLDKGHEEIRQLCREKPKQVMANRNLRFLSDRENFHINGGRYLEAALHPYRKGEVVPNIELRPDVVTVHTSWALSYMESAEGVTYEKVRQRIRLQSDTYARFPDRRIPADLTHIDLVFDFISNNGYFEEVLQQLKKDFEVERIDIFRDKQAELRDFYRDIEKEERELREREAEEGEERYKGLAEEFE